MSARGIDVVRAHLAKMPPATSVAERRAQYDRAERVFPVPADVGDPATLRGPSRAEWLEPPARARGRRDALSPRRRLRDRLAALAPSPRRRPRPRPRAPRRCCPTIASRPSIRSPPRSRMRWRPIAGCSTGASPRRAWSSRAIPRAAASPWRPCSRCASAACPCPRRASASRPGWTSRAAALLRDQGRQRSHRHPRGRDPRWRAPMSGATRRADAAGLAALRRSARAAAAARPGGQRGGAPRRRRRPRRAREGRGRGGTLEVWPDMIHVWHWFFPMLDEGQRPSRAPAPSCGRRPSRRQRCPPRRGARCARRSAISSASAIRSARRAWAMSPAPALAAAVSAAGGLGVIAAANWAPRELREEIRRSARDRPALRRGHPLRERGVSGSEAQQYTDRSRLGRHHAGGAGAGDGGRARQSRARSPRTRTARA